MKIQEILQTRFESQKNTAISDYFRLQDQFAIARQSFDQGRRIFRGLMYDGLYMYQPQMSPGSRKSANTQNWYTLIMDNTPEWSHFPKRSASVICSTDTDYAAEFGNVYTVLPFGDPLIGICPKEDIWHSFPSLDALGISLETLNEIIEALYETYFEDGELDDTNWLYFTNGLKKLTRKILRKPQESFLDYVNEFQDLVISKKDVLTVLRELLNPQKAGFQTARLSEWKPKPLTEIWFTAPAFFINYSEIIPVDQGIDAKIKGFSDKEIGKSS